MGTVKRRGAGWQATYRGPDHRERTKTFSRKVDAEAWLANQQAAISGGGWVDPSAGKVTLEVFATQWIDQRTDLSERTEELYRWLLKRHILPSLGKHTIAGLSPRTFARGTVRSQSTIRPQRRRLTGSCAR